jgi:hypothetical protein
VIAPFDEDTNVLYKKILDKLILFQTRGIDGLNLDLCYPHKSFDRQSMMWDMNYFKYMLLKLLAAPFNERRLEHDFNTLADYLLETGQDYFLYRDFQTANVMVIGEEPWFIDYQGGRKGALLSMMLHRCFMMQKYPWKNQTENTCSIIILAISVLKQRWIVRNSGGIIPDSA